ncbi:uncharacterized protein K489DRAFT_414206 [Dissoconium aciculare CBS 342.82]|uniref:Uncharacterized protein n=1 Tax=Dissoconium aciculare CBS 342.82 TaxID=1314786 RepID=A0A6J3LQF9_9PEZI|nr:uncharacterized protein K489DRAFT_414206 [Dissoconium aciculare CBS 342.82]KAF1817873.1 hypothetical protein K489DRAFT_414206 [Dissoconium aciculare CBS 342.82]
MMEEQAKAAKKGKKKVDATPISTTPGAKKVTPKDTFLSYGKTSTTADKPTTFVDLTKSRLAKVDAAIKAAEMGRKRPREEEVAPTPRPASQPRLILNKDDKALFDVYTMRPVFDDDLTNEAILLFRRQWQRDQPMEMALPLLNITTPTSPSPRLITNQGDRALFERYTRRPLLDDDICNEFILLCRRQYDRDRRRTNPAQATTSPVVSQTPAMTKTTRTSTTPAPTTAAATKTAGRTPATTATKTGKDAIMNTWLRTPEKTTPAAPTSTPAPPTTTPAAPSTPPRAPTTPPTPTPAQPSPPPKPNRGAGCGRGRGHRGRWQGHYSRAITPLHTRYEEHQQDELKDGWRPVMSSLF